MPITLTCRLRLLPDRATTLPLTCNMTIMWKTVMYHDKLILLLLSSAWFSLLINKLASCLFPTKSYYPIARSLVFFFSTWHHLCRDKKWLVGWPFKQKFRLIALRIVFFRRNFCIAD